MLRLYIAPRPSGLEGPGHFLAALTKSLPAKGVQEVFRLSDRPDVLLVPGGAPAGFLEETASMGIPVVQRLDGVYFDITEDYAERNVPLRRTLEQADTVIFQSEYSREMALRFIGRPRRHLVIYNSADPEIFSPSGPIRRPPFDRVVMAASRWRPHKRLRDVVDAFQRMRDGRTCLVIAGSMDSLSLNLSASSDILLLGDVSQAELASWLRGADVFVHPAWRDWCPNVVVQALACGVPVVCSSLGGTHELVGDAGIVVESGEHEEFRPLPLYDEARILRLDPDRLSSAIEEGFLRKGELKKRSQARASGFLSMDHVVEEYMHVLQAAAARGTSQTIPAAR